MCHIETETTTGGQGRDPPAKGAANQTHHSLFAAFSQGYLGKKGREQGLGTSKHSVLTILNSILHGLLSRLSVNPEESGWGASPMWQLMTLQEDAAN